MERRKFIVSSAAAIPSIVLAGCLGGDSNGEENGDDNGTENGDDNGTENGDDDGMENGDDGENGDDNGTENGNENGSDNGNEDGSENGNDEGDDTPNIDDIDVDSIFEVDNYNQRIADGAVTYANENGNTTTFEGRVQEVKLETRDDEVNYVILVNDEGEFGGGSDVANLTFFARSIRVGLGHSNVEQLDRWGFNKIDYVTFRVQESGTELEIPTNIIRESVETDDVETYFEEIDRLRQEQH